MVLPRKRHTVSASHPAPRKPQMRQSKYFERHVHSAASSRLRLVLSAVGIFASIALLLNVRFASEFRRNAIQPTSQLIHQQGLLRSNGGDDYDVGEHMASCILIMDDNHWLVEWLAYHYTTVNLRHIILAIDGRSQTSPITILDRWSGRINFELWNDEHFFPKIPDRLKDLQIINERRQQVFLATCMRELKLKHPNTTWVMFTDTDEFINVNPLVNQYRVNGRSNPLYRWRATPNLAEHASILKWIEQERIERNASCFSMVRNQLSPNESDDELVQSGVPAFLNGSNFLTLRWLLPAGDLVGPKNVLHLPSVPWDIMPANRTHQHRVIPELCEEAGHSKTSKNSLLKVHHYLGTLEQFHFRDDARSQPGNSRQYGRNTRFQRYMGNRSANPDDSLRPWLRAFFDRVGEAEAARLLEGVGRTSGWPPAAAHFDRYAFVPPEDDRLRHDADQEKKDEGDDGDYDDGDDEGKEGEGDDGEDEDGDGGEEEGDDGEEMGDDKAKEEGGEEGDDEAEEGNGEAEDGKDKGEPRKRIKGGDEQADTKRQLQQSEVDAQEIAEDGDEVAQGTASLVFSAARPDRSGAVVMDMMMAHAYAFANNLTYGGACATTDSAPHLEEARSLIVATGLGSLLKVGCPSNNATSERMLDRSKYTERNVRIFSKEYLEFVRSRVRYPPERHGGAVVHVRRGDVSPCGRYSNRYLPNSYYMDIINDLLPPGVQVTILTESERVEPLDDFANLTVLVDSDLAAAWQAMMTADFVVLSRSSFSFVPAMLNPTGTVMYTPFHKAKLPGWVTVPEAMQEKALVRVREIIRTMCSEEEQKVALRKLSKDHNAPVSNESTNVE